MALGSSVGISGDTAIPMDVDRVEKGKGKKGKGKSSSKGKDKGKGDQKGKASGKKGADNGKGYGNQQSWGSRQTSWQSSSWSAVDNNNGKSGKSGKGRKSKDGSKGKDFTCHKCGKYGHFARDCRVRAVGQDDNATAQTGEKTNSGSNTTNGTVNRVSFAPSSSSTYRQLDFDLTGMDRFHDFSTSHVNMVSKQHTRISDRSGSDLTALGQCGDDAEKFSCCADEFTRVSTGLDVSADVFTCNHCFNMIILTIFDSVFSVTTVCTCMMLLTVIQVVANSSGLMMDFSCKPVQNV